MNRHAQSSESGRLTKNHADATLFDMTEQEAAQYAARFSRALVSEIKAEMGRQDLSSRALGRLIDRTSQYMSFRLDGGNPKTGERVPLNVEDLYAIASALGTDARDLMSRAATVVAKGEQVATPAQVVERYLAQAEGDPAVASRLLAHDGAKGANVDVFTWTAGLEELHRLEQEEQDRAARNEDREPPKMGDE